MATNTSKDLRNKLMYQIFVRDFSVEGTFSAVISELNRIRDLGVDIIYLLPIHPIGEVARKGSLGSPYAIRDYRAINPEYGSEADFCSLLDAIHKKGMKCIIDVVYNHTSPDSVLAKEHPEWFYHKPDGSFGNRVGDWTGIVDLDYGNRDLWDYQIETLCYWAKLVDGFRCDVAPLVPLEFWLKARQEVSKVNPDAIWLSESVEPDFIRVMRAQGITALSDSEIFQAFDISYDYDIYGEWTSYLTGFGSLSDYAKAVCRQEYIYPDNYVKLKFLENHDQTRARFFFTEEKALKNATAWSFFQKGTAFIYAGQEVGAAHLPSLFDKDTVEWDSDEKIDLSDYIRHLAGIKKDEIFAKGSFEVKAHGSDILIAEYTMKKRRLIGIFSLKGEAAAVPVKTDDGIYKNMIDGSDVEVFHNLLRSSGDPVIIEL